MTKLDDLIRSARDDEPRPEQLASLERKLAGLLVPPTPGGGGSGGAGGPAAAGGGVKLAIGVAGVGIAAAIAVVVLRAEPERHHVVDAAAVVVVPAPVDAAMPAPDAAVVPPPVAPHVPPRSRDLVGPEQSLAIEGELLETARRALVDNDAARALATCDRHARRFPRGALREERERLAIEALVKLGRRREAVARVAAFDRAFPDSVQSERVHALLDSQ